MEDPDIFSLRIPGNALLAGEFAVLREGGRGITLAVDRYAVLKAEKNRSFSFSGTTGARRISINKSLFLQRLINYLTKTYGSLPPYRMELDSSALYYGDGRKRGLGSSAVTALALTAAFQRIIRGKLDKQDLLVPAIEAHRTAQQGKGSGYDVAASCFGGTQLFIGGDFPRRETLDLPWLPSSFLLLPGPEKTTTSHWVQIFQNSPSPLIRDWPDQSNRLVNRLIKAGTREEALILLQEYKDRGNILLQKLGLQGLSSAMREELDCRGLWKNLGAGYELIGLWDGETRNGEERFHLTEGLV